MIHPQILISQAHKDRLGLRRKRRPQSKSAIRKASLRPSAEAELTYRKGLRAVVALWAGRVRDALAPWLVHSVQGGEARTDAKESPLEKLARRTTRPANDALGTTTKQTEKTFTVNVGAFDKGTLRPQSFEFLKTNPDKANTFGLPRIEVYPDATSLADGRHRLTLAHAKGETSALVEVHTFDNEANLLSKRTVRAKLVNEGRGPSVSIAEARRQARDTLVRMRERAQSYGPAQQRLIDLVAGKVDRNSASEFQRVIGIDVKQTGASIANEIQDFRKENTDLITSIPEQLIDQVSDTLEKGWDAGVRVEELSAAIQDRFDVAESRADLIARDQTLKLNAQISETRAVASGITRYIWSTSHDERVRGNPSGKYPNPSKTGRVTADHYHLDGKTFSYSDPPVVDERTGRRENPGGDFQCRCVAAPVLDWLEE